VTAPSAEITSEPNFSAENVAAARALSARIQRPPVGNPDYLAQDFLGWKFTIILNVPPLRWIAYRMWDRLIPGIVGYLNARTHIIDATVKAAVGRGVGQVLILGAGYDSRAYRLTELDQAVIFEVDGAATLRRKEAVIIKRLGGVRPNVHFIDGVVGDDALAAQLEKAGLKRGEPILVVFEGLSYYLSSEDHDALFAFLCDEFHSDVEIIFDYLYQEALDGDPRFLAAKGAIEYLRKKGQPYRFGIPVGGVGAYVSQYGFELVEDLAPGEMEDRYLRHDSGELAEPAFVAYGMAAARRTGAGG